MSVPATSDSSNGQRRVIFPERLPCTFSECRPPLGNIARIPVQIPGACTIPGQFRVGQTVPKALASIGSTRFGPDSTGLGPKPAESGRAAIKFDEFWDHIDRLHTSRPKFTDVGHVWDDSDLI